MTEVPRKPTFPQYMIQKVIDKVQQEVNEDVIPVSTGIYSEEKLIQKIQAIPKPIIEDYGDSVFFQLQEKAPICTLEKCPSCQDDFTNKNLPAFCHFCSSWNCSACLSHRKRLHPRDSNPNGKRYGICGKCDSKFLNLLLGHNYVENRMLLERAITTVSKQLDSIEAEVEERRAIREEKRSKPKMQNNFKISKMRKEKIDLNKQIKKYQFEDAELREKEKKLLEKQEKVKQYYIQKKRESQEQERKRKLEQQQLKRQKEENQRISLELEKQKQRQQELKLQLQREIEQQQQRQREREVELQKQRERIRYLQKQREMERQKQIEKMKQLEKQRQIERLQEMERQIKLEKQREIQKQIERERQKQRQRKIEQEKQRQKQKIIEENRRVQEQREKERRKLEKQMKEKLEEQIRKKEAYMKELEKKNAEEEQKQKLQILQRRKRQQNLNKSEQQKIDKEKQQFMEYFVEDFTLSTPPQIDDNLQDKMIEFRKRLDQPEDVQIIEIAKQRLLQEATKKNKINWKELQEEQESLNIDPKAKCKCIIF